MPQASIVEWVAGGTLPRHRRSKEPSVSTSNTTIRAQHRHMNESSDSSCCPTCCSCSSCDSRSETSCGSPSKKVRFKDPKGILKHARRTKTEEHKCCSACTLTIHCNERHTVGKNGKVYGSSKKCAPKNRKKESDSWGEDKSRSNSPQLKKDKSHTNYTVNHVQLPPSPPQTPQQRRALQNLSSFITKNMSRLILPSRAEVIIREDVLENASDPRPNAFFDARTGMLRVYHGPVYGNPGGSLVPLQAQHVPIGTPAPPTSAWTNPWAGMMGGLSGRWPFGVNQRGGGGDFGRQYSGNAGNMNYSSGNNYNRQRKHSSGDTKTMPGSFNNDNDQNDNPSWNTADNNANGNFNDDAWGTGNNTPNNDPPSDNEAQDDAWGTNDSNNNTSSGNDNWGTSNNTNNTFSGNDAWATGADNTNDTSNNYNWNKYNNNNNRYNNNTTKPSKRLFPDTTNTEFSAGSWGVDENSAVARSGNVVSMWGEPNKQESWGDKSAAQSTRNNSADDTSGW